MANGAYENGYKNFALGNVVWKNAGGSTILLSLVDTADYTVNLNTDDALDDIAGAALEETSGAMTLSDATVGGVVDAADVAFVGTAGDQCEGVVVYRSTGVASTSWLLFWWDTATGLPVTLGGDVNVAFNASGLATI